MAITKTVFTATNADDSLREIGEWLTANASVLGFTVSTDETGNVICTSAGGTNFLKFCANNVSRQGVDIAIANGSAVKHKADNNNCPSTWTSGYACANGLVLFANSKSVGYYWVFISKTKSGGLCIVYQNTYSSLSLYYCDVENGVGISTSSSISTIPNLYPFTNGKHIACTSFAPICFDSGDTTETLFFTPQTQYPLTNLNAGLEMVIVTDGNEYIYSGIIAMKG